MNKREIARQNELRALTAIANCGWLTTRLVALWTFQNSEIHSAVVQAQRVTRRLEERKMVCRRDTPAGVSAWILTKRGAEFVNCELELEREQEGWHGWAHHGYELGFLEYHRHTSVCEYLAERQKKPGVVEVLARARMRREQNTAGYKTCDALIIEKAQDGDYTVTGVLAVSNASETNETRVRDASKQCDSIELICEPAVRRRLIAKLRT